jgi:hypothetical protein
MAEPTSRRDQVEDDLQEKLVEILKPEVEAAATQEPPPKSTDKDFFHALGGWGALLDIGLPWIAFLVAYAATDHKLQLSLIIAVALAAVLAVVRLIRRQPLRNVVVVRGSEPMAVRESLPLQLPPGAQPNAPQEA